MNKKRKKIFQVILLVISLSACSNDEKALFDDVATSEIKQEKTFHSKILHSENARETYEKLLGYFQKSQTRSEFGDKYPDFYGGSFINSYGELVVLYKSNDKNLLKIRSVQSYFKSDSIKYVSCDFSFNELTEAIDVINKFHWDNPIRRYIILTLLKTEL